MITGTFTLDLNRHLKSFRVLTAEWWDTESKFVVVRGATKKDPEGFALRLDLEKRAFLDHVPNTKTDELIQGQVSEISRLVWSERLKQREELAAAQGAA
jgi:hypothetical protein